MFCRTRFSKYFLLVISVTFATVGIFQAGYLIGLAGYSEDFSFSSISLLQISLLLLGAWGVFELIRRVKRSGLKFD
ncbi:hypothetical protein swp_1048 [Shewanella piezotolerans WP3]|uniref:Uncharacterized protein n=1 Tax=Shewanella piezotolerans (strain WP3 / JCM 13877) TaxID=225849 RepID=B8CJ89_SHEPW|nr:hypothetical protein [Shewanella piezotolerans]ACJ27851.1 hypothetical protein swp_1048 [Shewanella piezotolerans WP3]